MQDKPMHSPVVRSTASAEHVDMRKAAPEIAVLGAKLYGVADAQLGLSFCDSAAIKNETPKNSPWRGRRSQRI
jgi:hypothetical protein